jgi:hypothetical protein
LGQKGFSVKNQDCSGRQIARTLPVIEIASLAVYMSLIMNRPKEPKVEPGILEAKFTALEARLAVCDTTLPGGWPEEQLSIIREMAEGGKASIPYLFRAINFKKRFCDNYDWELLELLYTKCKKYPKEFSKIIMDRSQSETTRWYAINAVRGSQTRKCYDALVDVLNSKDSHNLRIQAMMAVIHLPWLSRRELRRCEDGFIAFLQDGTRRTDLNRAINLLSAARSEKAVPYLVKLLDDTYVYSKTRLDDGTWRHNTIAADTHKALKNITGRNLPPKMEIWQKYLQE